MTKDELLFLLSKEVISLEGDEEYQHMKADELLIEYINDEDIANAYNQIKKWYA